MGKFFAPSTPRYPACELALANVLAVEMQAAALFAFGIAKQAFVASVAMVSNAVDHTGKQFDTGSQDDGLRILKGI